MADETKAPSQGLSADDLKHLSIDLDEYMKWAEIWHHQAGGYLAADTARTVSQMQHWAAYIRNLSGHPENPLRRSFKLDG